MSLGGGVGRIVGGAGLELGMAVEVSTIGGLVGEVDVVGVALGGVVELGT